MPHEDQVAGGGELAETPVPDAAAALERALLANMSRTEVIFLRHGQQDFTLARARPGKTDPPLTVTGRRQAERAGVRLASEGIVRVYCSNLRRARETAEIVAPHVRPGEQPVVVPDLREVMLFRDMPEDRPLLELLGQEGLQRAADAFMRTRRFDAFPMTETSEELRARALGALSAIVQAHDQERVAVVAHGGFINSFLAAVFGIPQDMFFYPAHASVTRVLFNDGRWALYSANETTHLQHGEESLVTF
jgi:probable phosphoglycerate mutase